MRRVYRRCVPLLALLEERSRATPKHESQLITVIIGCKRLFYANTIFSFRVTPKIRVTLQHEKLFQSFQYNNNVNAYCSINYYLLLDPLQEAMTLNSVRPFTIYSDVSTANRIHLIRIER